MYDTVEEARQKLESSVVLYDSVPVYIQSCSGKKNEVNLTFINLPVTGKDQEKTIRSITDPRWDFRSIGTRLGYTPVKSPVNNSWETVFVSRVPIRHSRQGLDNSTVSVIQFDTGSGYGYSWNDVLMSGGLIRTIKGDYPSTESAFDKITKDPELFKSIPVHRKLALFYDKVNPPNLLYRNDRIGYTEDGRIFKLAKHKNFLREELTDVIGLKIA